MKGILIYQPADKTAPVPDFIDGLDPRLREKAKWIAPSNEENGAAWVLNKMMEGAL